jgi:hypothetical protein
VQLWQTYSHAADRRRAEPYSRRADAAADRRGPIRDMIRRVDDLARLADDLLARAKIPEFQTDMAPWMPLPAPASVSDFRRAETLIGCTLPPAIMHIYSVVGNGGFGPGYGLVGIGGGRPGFSNSQGQRHCEEEYVVLRQDAGITWPAHLLPLCDWGCAIYSCADASQTDAPIFTAFGDALYDDPPHAVMPANCTFAGWLRAWTYGEDLWAALNAAIPSA